MRDIFNLGSLWNTPQVCRQAGYFKHALFLAEKHMQHDWYLKVQLEDIKDYQKALNYITTLEFNEVW